MATVSSHPDTSTLHRSQVVQSLVQRVFAVTFTHLSRLHSRSIREYCLQENIPKWVENYFKPEEKLLIDGSDDPTEFEVSVLYKLLKICCGLEHPKHAKWDSEEDKTTFEYLITLNWTNYRTLQQCLGVTDENLNTQMDRMLQTLTLLLEKVEKEKCVNEWALKADLKKRIGEKVHDVYGNSWCCQHMYSVLTENSVHQMLVMVYRRMNTLGTSSLSEYLNRRRINLVPCTSLSVEKRFLDSNPPPEKIPVRMLFRVVRRVCFKFSLRRRTRTTSVLETILHELKKEYYAVPTSEMEYSEKCYKLYGILNMALQELCMKTEEDRRVIIGNLARETFLTESIEMVIEPPPMPIKPCNSELLDLNPRTQLAPPPPMVTQTTSTQSTLTIDEINISVLFKVVRPSGLISQTLAVVFLALKGDLTTKLSRNTMRDCFYKDERKQLEEMAGKVIDKDVLSVKDVAFLCKILRNCCLLLSCNEDVWQANGDTIEYHITLLRKKRNYLAHEVTSLTTQKLQQELELFENCLLTILEKAKRLLSDSDQNVMADLQKQIDVVKDEMRTLTQISKDLSHMDLWRELDKARNRVKKLNEARNRVKNIAQEELKQFRMCRENLACMSPIRGSIDNRHEALTVSKVFVQRELQGDQGMSINKYAIKDVLFTQSTPLQSYRIIILHGGPGDGKTSICKYIFHLWARNVNPSSQSDIDLLFYIPCRYVTTKSLSTYIKSKLPQAFRGKMADDVIPFLQELKVTFVFDGYKEGGDEAMGLIDEALTSLPDSKFIITTKSQWLPKLVGDVKNVTEYYKVLSIVPMSEKERMECVKRLFGAMKRSDDDCDAFLRHLDKMRDDIHTLVHLPLTFSLLALLWIEEPRKARNIRTLPQLYHKLIQLILNRVMKLMDKDNPHICHEWMLCLGELAWRNLKERKHHITEKEMVTLTKKVCHYGLTSEESSQMVSSLLYCEIQEQLVSVKKIWTFSSVTQQIYLAAEHIVGKLMNDRNESLGNTLELPVTFDDKSKDKLQMLVPVLEFVSELLVIREGVTERIVSELASMLSVKEAWCFIALERIFKSLQGSIEIMGTLKSAFAGGRIGIFYHFEPSSTLWVLQNTSLQVETDVTLTCSVNDVVNLKPLLDFLKTGGRCIKTVVEFERVSNTSSLFEFVRKENELCNFGSDSGEEKVDRDFEIEFVERKFAGMETVMCDAECTERRTKRMAEGDLEFTERNGNTLMGVTETIENDFMVIEKTGRIHYHNENIEQTDKNQIETTEKKQRIETMQTETNKNQHSVLEAGQNDIRISGKKPRIETRNIENEEANENIRITAMKPRIETREKSMIGSTTVIKFFFSPFKPQCLSKLIQNWVFEAPLPLSFYKHLFPLLWWQCLMSLITFDRTVTKIACSPRDQRILSLIQEDAKKLSAGVVLDDSLDTTELLIYAS